MTDFLRRLVKEKPLSIIAGVVILLLMLVAIFADVLAPFPHDEVNIVDRMQAPSGRYLLGTDQLGRDLLSRLIFGAQISSDRRSGGDRCECRGGCADRRTFRILRR